MTVFRVTVDLVGRNAKHPDYPLLPGDLITLEDDGLGSATMWRKHAPGLSVGGFRLSIADVETLELAPDARWELV